MAQIIEVPNYGPVEFPDGMTDEDIVKAIKKNSMNYKVGAGETAQKPKGNWLKPELPYGNILAGAVKGATDIGATLLAPVDALGKALPAWLKPELAREGRRDSVTDALSSMGADKDSIGYGAGRLGAQIAGTAGVGGGLANALANFPLLATKAPNLINAVRSGGMVAQGGGMPTRIAGGAITGGAMAGLTDPGQAGTGALIGGALPPAVKGAGAVGKAISTGAKKAIGATTGVGDEAIDAALQAGKSGNKTFVENMRREVPLTDVLDQAKSALGNMRMQRAAEYRANMANITSDKTVLDVNPIIDAVKNLKATGTYKGQVINKNAAGTVDDISNTVSDWMRLNPAEYHTPEGLDALKKAIGDIRDTTQFGTAARKSADEVYNAVKNQITMQAPTYAKTMKAYSEASDLISEIERSLSLGNKAAADTSMRKLQSLMRNNVQTNYGNRLDLAKSLAEKGGEDIIPAVAGQSLSSWMPRGLAKLGQYGAGIGAVFGNPGLAAVLPLTSPRLMGEALYGAGRFSSAASGTLFPMMGNPALAGSAPGLVESMMINPAFRAGLLATSP